MGLALAFAAALLAVILLGRHLRLPAHGSGPQAADPTPRPPTTTAPESAARPARSSAQRGFTKSETRSESTGAGAGQSESALIDLLKNTAQPLKERRRAARALARSASPEVLAALQEVLRQGPPELAVVIAEGFGLSANPQARVLLRSLANDPDEAIARGGARGWAVVGTDEAAQVLNGLLQGDTRPASVRAEAASALGEMAEAPAAYAALTNAAWQLKSPELVTSVLEGLGHRSIAESQAFFAEYLSNPAIPTDLRVAAVEALGNAAGDPSALLLRYAADADPEVRAGAAAALGSTEQKGSVGPDLLGLLQTETEPDVRMRLYQALGNQQQTDLGAVLESVQRESQTDVRIAGLDLLAQSLQDRPNAQLQAYFEQTGVPSLKETAMNAETSFERVSSVLALQRLTSAQSVAALEEVLQRSTDPKVMDAAKRALKQPR